MDIRLVKQIRFLLQILPLFLKNNGGVVASIRKLIILVRSEGILGIKRRICRCFNQTISNNSNVANESDYERIYATYYENVDLDYQPLVSIVMPVFNIEQVFIEKAVKSIERQNYKNWELCIADDASTEPHIRPFLEKLLNSNKNIKVVFLQENVQISRASNAALKLASGEYVLMMDNDDMLFTSWALKILVSALQSNNLPDIVYADNVMVDANDKILSYSLKPDWSPEFFLSTCYISHPKLIKKRIIDKVGGFRHECTGAQDIDLLCRILKTTNKITHLPHPLYSWRVLSNSVTCSIDSKPYIIENSLRAYNDYIGEKPCHLIFSESLKKWNCGIYKLEFDDIDEYIGKVLPVFIDYTGKSSVNNIISVLDKIHFKAYSPMIISDSPLNFGGFDGKKLKFKDALGAIANINADIVLFIDARVEIDSGLSIKELLGYLASFNDVAVCGGKVLDRNELVKYSSYVFGTNSQMLNYGCRDSEPGIFFNNLIAHNTHAVPGVFCAFKMEDLRRALTTLNTDFSFFTIPSLCLIISNHGRRIVFNPWAKARICDSVIKNQVNGLMDFTCLAKDMVHEDRYYMHLG